jgi:hypothetical protein
MAYGSIARLFDRSSAGAHPSAQLSERLRSGWHRLDPELRFSLVETALKPGGTVFAHGLQSRLEG